MLRPQDSSLRRSLAARLLLFALLPTVAPAAAFSSPSGTPRPLTGRGADNLAAFARLLSVVRFFHPSDQAAATDWNRLAVAGIGAVEEADDASALARILEGLVRPIAPTVRIYPSGGRPELDPALRPPNGESPPRIVAWRHYGGKLDGTSKVFSSERIDNLTPPGFGTLVQAVDPGAFRGRRIRLRARVRAEMEANGKVQLGLRVDLPGGRPGFLDNMADRPLRSTEWRTVEIEGDVAPNAERIVVLLVLTGGGRVWLDEVTLAPADGKGKAGAILANPGFDEGEVGTQPPGWHFPYESIRAGYHLVLRRGEPCLQGGCAEIASDEIAAPRFSPPAEVLELDLGGGVAALVPTTLYADESGTLPKTAAPAALNVPIGEDTRETRLAALLLAWGIFAHLHPTFDAPPDDWAAALRATLPEAAAAPDREAFRRAVRRLLARVGDLMATEPSHRDDARPARLPIAWEWIEDRLVVTQVLPGITGIQVGDVVVALNGRPIAEVIAEEEALVSAATPEARRRLTLAFLAAGPPGSAVDLGLERTGEGRLGLLLDRQPEPLLQGTPLPPVSEPRPKVLYVDLRRITKEDFQSLLPRLAAAKGVVFDLRGSTDVGTELLSHLATRTAQSSNWQVPVILRPDRQGLLFLTSIWTIEPKTPRISGKVAFLADARAHGYSETLLEMIAAYRWAEIVGAATAGNNGNRNWSDLPGGWTVTWTGQRVLEHDGTLLNGIGVRPTIPAVRTLRGVTEGRDEIVERAVEVVGG